MQLTPLQEAWCPSDRDRGGGSSLLAWDVATSVSPAVSFCQSFSLHPSPHLKRVPKHGGLFSEGQTAHLERLQGVGGGKLIGGLPLLSHTTSASLNTDNSVCFPPPKKNNNLNLHLATIKSSLVGRNWLCIY